MSPQYETTYEINRKNIIKRLISEFGGGAGKNALDIGCYRGFYSEYLLQSGYKTTGVDINKNEINLAYERCSQYKDVKFMEVNLEEYNFRELGVHFDLVLCLELIEHLEHYHDFIRRITEVMTDDGKLIITTPNIWSLEGFRGKVMEYLTGIRFNGWDPTHKKIFNAFEFTRFLKETGRLKILKTIGYWYSSNEIKQLKFRLRLPLQYTSIPLINMFGWNTIVVAEKI